MGDPLNYLLELGFTLDEVETLKSRNDFTCQQMADAAKAIVDRGGNPLEAFGPRATGWEKPIPFDEIQTPDFPVEALPGPLGAFVECLAESTQTPEEMGGTLSLGVLATAFQRRYEVEVTRDWREPLCLYSSAVAPPGERKSAVISALNKPIYEYEAEVRAAEAARLHRTRPSGPCWKRPWRRPRTAPPKVKRTSRKCGRRLWSCPAKKWSVWI